MRRRMVLSQDSDKHRNESHLGVVRCDEHRATTHATGKGANDWVSLVIDAGILTIDHD
jgi:hypothetical protein